MPVYRQNYNPSRKDIEGCTRAELGCLRPCQKVPPPQYKEVAGEVLSLPAAGSACRGLNVELKSTHSGGALSVSL